MKHSVKFNLTGGVILFCLAMCLTSCEGALDDVLGEWSRPTPGNNTNTTPTADHSNQYLVYSYSTALDSVWTNIEGATVWTGTVAPGNVAAGTYVVEGTATCAGQLVLMGEVNLILKDGAKLTVDDGIYYDTTGDAGSLNIYGQGISSNMGQLVVNNDHPVDLDGDTTPDGVGLMVKNLTIHGCKISTTADTGTTPATGLRYGIEVSSITIFNGDLTSRGKNEYATGIQCNGTSGMSIYGGTINAYGGDATASGGAGQAIDSQTITIKSKAVVKATAGAYFDATNQGASAISCADNLEISEDAEVYATATDGGLAAILSNNGNITIKGKKLEATCTGTPSGIETGTGNIELSAGTFTIKTATGLPIQSMVDVNITANVTKVDMTKTGAAGNGATDNTSDFIAYAGTFTLGGTDVNTLLSPNTWNTPVTINTAKGVITTLSYDEPTKTLTYVP